MPLYTQVLIAVIFGGLLGVIFGQEPYLGGITNAQLGKLGMVVVQLLKTLAIPLIFFAILDALIRTSLPLSQGTRLLGICLVNVTVAMTIGLVIMNTWQPGLSWQGHVDQLLQLVPGSKAPAKVATSQTPIEDLAAYIPRTILSPFSTNNIIGVVLLALVLGTFLRRLHIKASRAGADDHAVVRVVEWVYEWLVRILGWIIHLVPLAVFGVVAQVVGKSGVGVFSVLWIFLVAMLAGHVDQLLQLVPGSKAPAKVATSQTPIEDLAAYIPRTILSPFSTNNIIGVVLLALVLGTFLRRLHIKASRAGADDHAVVRVVEWVYEWLVRILGWIIHLVPLAVFGVVAQVVGKSGVGVFSVLWIFLVAMLAGLMIHSLIYYPLVAWFVGKKSPKVYVGEGADAILTAISCNSSLATVPVTLQCLHRMNVSAQSARLAACVGTNLNNDGITLYEAMAALFLAQALGYDLSLTSQFLIVAASIIAGAGVAGIPEAGLIVLPLVLSAAGLPDSVIAAAIPLIMTVDWIIARARSGVNVMSDMLVAILLDVGHAAPAAQPVPARYQPEPVPRSEWPLS